MKILFVSVEVAPFAKVGGLADVIGSLPKALKELGHDVRVAMPAYGMIEKSAPKRRFEVETNEAVAVQASLTLIDNEGVPTWLLGGVDAFDKVERSEQIYSPGRDDYLFFSKATLQACKEEDWIPDVISVHDWHTGFVPVLMREAGDLTWNHVGVSYTIHNLAYQGEFGPDTLDVVGLPKELFDMHRLETWGTVNFLKCGCSYADQANTVSPTYASEIQTEEYGCRLHGLMKHLYEHERLQGILNGIDTDLFNPASDPHIPARFTAQDLSGKGTCKAALEQELGFDNNPDLAFVGVVSRLSNQKGFDLILEAAETALRDLPIKLAVLGTGDPWAAAGLRNLSKKYPKQVALIERFDAPLAQRIYAGSDLFLMPSSFEPCGLGQMIALRYGTIPVVRRTGGLADTVFEGVNGFVFEHRNAVELFSSLMRAVRAFNDKTKWDGMVRQAMAGDYGWSRSAGAYMAMFEAALEARKLPAPDPSWVLPLP